MGYTIVYDRLFVRAGDKYIPICLYGSSNCTEYVNGREVRERSWSTFSYCDEMLLADEETLMREVKARHTGTSSENFKYKTWLDDAAVIRFFENGIKNAVTIEEMQQQLGSGEAVDAYLSCWPADGGWSKTQIRKQLRSSDEIEEWTEAAKAKKTEMLDAGDWNSVYICFGFSGREPKRVLPNALCNAPLIVKCMYGYVSEIVCKGNYISLTYSKDISKAIVFENLEKAREALPDARFTGLKFIPAVVKEKAAKKNWVLSVRRSNVPSSVPRVFIRKISAKHCWFTDSAKDTEKRFASPEAALKWYKEKIKPKYPALTNPEAIEIAE